MEPELTPDSCHALKTIEECKTRGVQNGDKNMYLRSQLKCRLSDMSSYKKSVIRDALFRALDNYQLISKIAVKGESELAEKQNQVRYAKEKLVRTVDGSYTYDIGLWRLCSDASEMTNKGHERGDSEPVSTNITPNPTDVGQDAGGTGSAYANTNDSGESKEYKYGLFRNNVVRDVWRMVQSFMCGERIK